MSGSSLVVLIGIAVVFSGLFSKRLTDGLALVVTIAGALIAALGCLAEALR